MKKSTTLLIASLAAISAASAQVITTNLNETFATDGNITNTTQNLPGSARWYSSQAAANVNIASGVMTLGQLTNTTMVGALAYFTTSGNYVTLAQDGDWIQLSLDYRYATNSTLDNTFRMGLYSSGGTRSTADANNFNANAFSNWTGYQSRYTFGTNSSTRYGVTERSNGANNLFGLGNTQITPNVQPSQGNDTNTWYSATLKFTLTNSTILIDASYAGQVISRTDSVTLWTNFDSVVFGASAPIGSYDIDNVLVTSSIVPEPTTVAMLGLSGLALVAYRLRRRNR